MASELPPSTEPAHGSSAGASGGAGTSGPGGPAPGGASSPRKRRRLKWLLIGVGGIAVGAGLLVLLAPTLLSTGPGKSIVLGQVNGMLAGRVEIDSWSLGWFSGVRAENVKVFDDQNRLAITVGSLKTDLSLTRAITGDFRIGDTVIDSPNLVLVEIDKDGRTNLERLVKTDPAPAKQRSDPAKTAADPKPADSKIPDVRGTLTIRNLTGTIQGAAVGAPLRIDSSTIEIKIPSLANEPVTNNILLAVRRDVPGQSSPARAGTIALTGTVQAIRAGIVDIAKLAADQKLQLTALDLSAANPLLALGGAGLSLEGAANGTVTIKLAGTDNIDAAGEIQIDALSAGGQALRGDTFRTKQLAIPVQVATVKGEGGATVLRIGKLGLTSDEVNVAVTGDISTAALENLAAMKAPGTTGTLKLTASVPSVATIAAQLPNTLALPKDLQLQAGQINATLNVALDPAGATVTGRTAIEGVRGLRAGRSVALSPVVADYDVKAGFSTAPAGGLTSLNIAAASLRSSFAEVAATGTLENLQFAADVSLDRAKQELGQFADLGQIDMAGRLTSKGTLTGNFTQGGDMTATVRADLTGVRLNLPPAAATALTPESYYRHAVAQAGRAGALPPAGQQLDIDRLTVESMAVLKSKGDQRFAVAEVRKLGLSAGPEASPVLRLAATATADLTSGDVPAFDVITLSAPSLPELQRRFGAFVPALAEQGLSVRSGSLSGGLGGSYVGGTLTLSKPLAVQLADVTLLKQGRPILQNQAVKVGAAGVVAMTAAGTRLDLKGVEVEASPIVSLRQSGDSLKLDLRSDGTLTGDLGLDYAADLAKLSDVANAFSPAPVASTGQPAPSVRSGLVRGQTRLTQGQGGAIALAGNADISALTVGDAIRNETATVKFDAKSPDQFKTLLATASITSSIATADVKDARLTLSGTGVGIWEMVQSAGLTLRADDLAKVDALLKALSPPAPTPAVATTPGAPPVPPTPPVYIRSGALAADINVTRVQTTTTLDVRTLTLSGLALSSGQAQYQMPSDVNLKVTAAIDAATPPNAPATAVLTDQIRTLTVSALSGSLGVAQVKLTDPIVASDLSAKSPKVKGAIELSGRIQTVTGLLEVLQGAAPGSVYPYVGNFLVAQKLTSDAGAVGASGSVRLDNLQVYRGRDVAFSEQRLEVTNDLSLNQASMDLTLRDLSVTTASSKALSLKATGVVKDLNNTRTISDPVRVKLAYDLEKLLPVIRPMLSPSAQQSLAGATVVGTFERDYVVTGSYPANVPFEQAIQSLTITGGLAIDRASIPAYGLELSAFDPAFKLDKGVATVTMSKPAGLNGGTLDLGGISLSLAQASPKLSMPAGKALLSDVSLNQTLAKRLGRIVSVFSNANDATGRVKLLVNECQRFPIDIFAEPTDTAGTKSDAAGGKLDIDLTVSQFGLTGGVIGGVLKDIPGVAELTSGELSKGRIVVQNGVAQQDIEMRLTAGLVKVNGGVELATQRLTPLTLYVGPAMAGGLLGPLKGLGGLTDIPIVITGTLDKPKWSVTASVRDYVSRNAGNLGGLPGDLGKFLGGNRGGEGGGAPPAPPAPQGTQPGPTSQPAQPASPIEGLLRGLGGNRDRDKKKK